MEKESLGILIVDPHPSDQTRLYHSLSHSEIPTRLEFVGSTEEAFHKFKGCDLILTEHHPPKISVFRLLQALQLQEKPVPVILVSHNVDLHTARTAFKMGLSDFLLKEELDSISLIELVTAVLANHHSQQSSERLLREEAERDGLTQLHNHRHFLDSLEKEFQRALRYSRPLSLVMIDLDGFKAINDNCGHLAGDRVLQMVARIFRHSVREVDLVARYGGDEFSILLPETEEPFAIKLAERILKELQRHPFLEEKKIFPISASLGVASLDENLSSPGLLLKAADEALYEAKRSGRGRVKSAMPVRSVYREPSLTPWNEFRGE